MVEYMLTDGPEIIRVADWTAIPNDPANNSYQAYLAWVAEGNTPNPYVPPPAPPPLTAAEKLEAAGLTVAELKELLGL